MENNTFKFHILNIISPQRQSTLEWIILMSNLYIHQINIKIANNHHTNKVNVKNSTH